MADQERMTAEFMELTNADAERAKFYLESSGWDVPVNATIICFSPRFCSNGEHFQSKAIFSRSVKFQLAVSSFFENDGPDMADEEPEIVREVPAPPRPPAQVKTEPQESKKKPEKKSSSSSSR